MLALAILSLPLATAAPAHLAAPDGAVNDIFGTAVAMSGPHLLVGAPIHGAYGYHAGAVYAYELEGAGWTLVQKIEPPVHESYGEFGVSLAVEDDTAVIGWIGAMDGDQRVGAAVVYEWSQPTWDEVQTILDPDGEQGDRFGTSVAIDADQMIVGCQLDDAAGFNAGSALVYHRLEGTWTFEARLLPEQGDAFSWAGRDVALEGDLAVLGAYKEWNSDIQAAGAAYVFARGSDGEWLQEARLTADDPVAGNYFGFSLSLDGERLAVGSILNDAPIEDSGAVYLFERQGGAWPQTKLAPPDVGG